MKGHPHDDRTQPCERTGVRLHDMTHRTGTAAIRIHIFNSTFGRSSIRLEPGASFSFCGYSFRVSTGFSGRSAGPIDDSGAGGRRFHEPYAVKIVIKALPRQ
jgi:hypothetical protein